MKIASTAAEAAVTAPKMSRNSRSQAIWYTSAQNPETEQKGGNRRGPCPHVSGSEPTRRRMRDVTCDCLTAPELDASALRFRECKPHSIGFRPRTDEERRRSGLFTLLHVFLKTRQAVRA